MRSLILTVMVFMSGAAAAGSSDCVTMAVYYEAGNQSIAGKIGVANVIRNRKEHHRWPNTYCEVVKQRQQFSFYWDGRLESMPRNASKAEAMALFESRVIAWLVDWLPDLTHGSLHYHSDIIPKPKSWQRLVHSVKLDNHEFYIGE